MRRADVALAGLGVVTAVATGVVLESSPGPDPTAGRNLPQPATTSRPVVAVLGDSYSGGSREGGVGARGWPAILGRRLAVDVDVLAVGGSGYVVDAPGRPGTSLRARAGQVAVERPDVVVVFAARNDVDAPTLPRLAAAERATLRAVRRGSPRTRLVVVGPVWAGDRPPVTYRRAAQIERAVAAAEGAAYLDGVTRPWFAGHPELIGADDVHPTNAGHVLMADRIEPAVRRALANAESAPAPGR